MLSTKYSLLFSAFLSTFSLPPSSSLRGRAMLSSYKWVFYPLMKRERFAVTTTRDFPFWCLTCCVIVWIENPRFAKRLGEELPELCCVSSWSFGVMPPRRGVWSAFACAVVGVSLAEESHRYWGGSPLCLHWLERAFLYRVSSTLPKGKLPRHRGKATNEYSITSIYVPGSKIYARGY